ncbi:MAG TPA: pyridoxal-phosphate dependent enzyme, partial [Chloroflexota bacterium]|nr:pyridoxal-phosphate dependent enzyme [Chloroflexota bacterium]
SPQQVLERRGSQVTLGPCMSAPRGPRDVFDTSPTALQRLHHPIAQRHDVALWLKRDDQIHQDIPGNKFRKLKYNIRAAVSSDYQSVLTFGGAFSSHIFATAHAGRLAGLGTVGVIRGEEHTPLNPILSHARDAGMQLIYVDRQAYRKKDDVEFLDRLRSRVGDFYLIPEGGHNVAGMQGCMEIVEEIAVPFDCIVTACGTGTTLAGLAAAVDSHQSALGIAVLRGGTFLNTNVSQLLADGLHAPRGYWSLETSFAFGGFAKVPLSVAKFIEEFQSKFGIQLDPIYTGKAMLATLTLIDAGQFPEGSVVVFVHTGGIPKYQWSSLV